MCNHAGIIEYRENRQPVPLGLLRLLLLPPRTMMMMTIMTHSRRHESPPIRKRCLSWNTSPCARPTERVFSGDNVIGHLLLLSATAAAAARFHGYDLRGRSHHWSAVFRDRLAISIGSATGTCFTAVRLRHCAGVPHFREARTSGE